MLHLVAGSAFAANPRSGRPKIPGQLTADACLEGRISAIPRYRVSLLSARSPWVYELLGTWVVKILEAGDCVDELSGVVLGAGALAGFGLGDEPIRCQGRAYKRDLRRIYEQELSGALPQMRNQVCF